MTANIMLLSSANSSDALATNALMPPKGKIGSKLSSRHNRRKRRDREHKERPAKKSRGVKRKNSDRIPIPSFTPITEEYHNEGAVGGEAGACVSTTLKKSSSACPTDRCSDTTKQIGDADTDAVEAGKLANDYATKETDDTKRNDEPIVPSQGEHPVAKQQKIVHENDKSPATETQVGDAKTVCSGDLSGLQTKDHSQHAAKRNSLPEAPTEMLPSAASTSEAAPQKADENAEMDTRQSPATENQAGDAETVCSGDLSGLQTKDHSQHAAKRNSLPEAPTEMLSSTSSTSEAAPQNAAENAEMDTLPRVKLDEEDNSHKGKLKDVGERSIKETCSGLITNSENHSLNETPQTPGGDSPEKTESDLEIEALLNSSSANKETISPTLGQQSDIKLKSCKKNESKGIENKNIKKMKRPEYFDSTKSGPSEIIDLMDDEDGDNEGTMPKAKEEGQPVKSNTTDKKNDALGKKRKPSKSSKTRKKRKSPGSVSRSSSDSSEDERVYDSRMTKKANVPKGPTKRRKQTTAKIKVTKSPKQPKILAGKNLCFACSSCKCSSRSGTAATPQKISSLSGSAARQEQSLVNRLQRIERDIAWKEGQRNEVARDLKRRRNQMIKKWGEQSSNDKAQRPQFLADVEVGEDLGGTSSAISLKEINRAQSRIFGRQKTHQPTLTQLIRGPKDDSDENPDESKSEDGEPEDANTLNAQQDDFLSFWADSAPTEGSTQCLGDMNYFNRAVANFKDRNRTGKWAKSTANSLQMEEDEGFDALVELFDASMENSKSSQIDDDDDDDDNDSIVDVSPISRPLSPGGKTVVKKIVTLVNGDSERKAAIDRMCPNWKENVELAQAQTDPEDLHDALQNVQQAKIDLEKMKDRILQAFLDRHQTLELYENTLQGSIDRLSEKESKEDCAEY